MLLMTVMGNKSFKVSTTMLPNKKPKLTCWKCGKPCHYKMDCRVGKGGYGKVK